MQPTVPVLPRYQRSPRARVFSAVFSGEEMLVEVGRARRYPALIGPGPDTRAVYDAAAAALAGASRVLDFGAGAGVGSAELRRHFRRVTAVDNDPEAVRFARAYLRGVEVSHDDGASRLGEQQLHDAVVLIDVLGQSPAPATALRRARSWLAPGGRVFIGEPRACPGQALLPPVLRAFSRPGLTRWLARAGLEPVEWLEGIGGFVACVARRARAEHFLALAAAEAQLAAGRPDLALAEYDAMPAEAPRELRAEALLGRAELLGAAGDYEAAFKAVLEAASLCPDGARPLAALSEVAHATGEPAQALALAARALQHDPCDPIAVQSLARAAGAAQEDEALAALRVANDLAPADLAVACELSRLAASRGQLRYAVWVLERLRELHPELGVDYHVTLAWLYLHAERPGEARLEAEFARALEPASPAVLELTEQLRLS